jgi:5'-nucleotidase
VETPGHVTDVETVADGFISVTPLHLDLTHDPSIAALADRFEASRKH